MHRIEEFMRGCIIEYQQTNQLKPNYLRWIETIVWGTTTDDNGRDIIEIGKFGSEGYIDLADVKGIEVTETILVKYGFILMENMSNISTYYRDDFGFVKLDTYGIEHIFMKGKPIKYLHSFQRVFFDYTQKQLRPKPSERPPVEFESKFFPKKKISTDEMMKGIEHMKSIGIVDKDKLESLELNIEL
jgi:hypothetical protein